MPLMSEWVLQTANHYPEDIALTQNHRHLSYAQLETQIQNAQKKCMALGLKSGDKVALILPNVVECVVLFYALNALGITVVMLHPLSSATLLKQRCELTQCTCVFILDVLEKRTRNALTGFQTVTISAAKSTGGLAGWAISLSVALSRSNSLKWDAIKASDSVSTVLPQQDAVILFSSGTSGYQKAIALSDDAMNALVNQMESVIVPQRGVDSMFCVLPFFHGFGLGIAMHTVLALGGRCILVPRLSKNTLIKTLLKEKPTYLAAVPYLLKVLLQDPRFVQADLSFIKQVFVGGESVSLSLIHEFNAVLMRQGSRAKIQVGYGTTETVTAVTLMDRGDSGEAGVGKPFMGNSILIIKEDGNKAEPNEPGEILISGPTLMNGYYRDDALTKRAIITIENKRYYKTKDIGHLDEKGILHFRHRSDELIKVKGYIVSPTVITQRLLSVSGIDEAKVIVNEEEQLVAVLSVSDHTQFKRLQKETTQILQDLDGWCIPKHYVIVKSMPVNEMRKVDLAGLSEAVKNRTLEFLSEWSL